MAEAIPDVELLTTEGYVLILQKILKAHQAYLEAELEKATLEFLHARAREKGELFTTYVAYLELLGRELDQQLSPAPPLDERIKAIVLLRNCHLDAEQRTQLAMKRAGTQPFQEVANQLRVLDRPEAFLQQSKVPPAVKRAYPLALEEPEENPEYPEGWTPPEVVQDLRSLVHETIQEMVPSNASLSTSQADSEQTDHSNSDFDAEGQLKLGFESDKEYSEGETLQILA